MSSTNLKLNGTSEDDMKVISAHLQDSITQVKNIAHLKKNKIFLIKFNSFMWEDIEKGVFTKNKRIISVLKFENVINVNSKNLNQKNTERFLDFLAIETKLLSDKNYEVKLNFAGDILIKLNLEIIECFLEDISDPWETKNKPKPKQKQCIKINKSCGTIINTYNCCPGLKCIFPPPLSPFPPPESGTCQKE